MFMPDLTFDWIWLYVQMLPLAAILVRELLKRYQPNLYAVSIAFTLLVVVQGQAWWMFRQFEESGDVILTHLLQPVSLLGARLANFYIGLGTICLSIAFWLCGGGRVARPRLVEAAPSADLHMAYALVAAWTLLSGILLLRTIGGLFTALLQPGQAISGQTVLLIALGLGKLPLLRKIAWRQRANLLDVSLYLFVLLLTLFNSRILVAFALLQFILVLNYSRMIPLRRAFIYFGVLIFLIVIVWGAYRDSGWRSDGNGMTLHAYLETLGPLTLLNWFYRANVEGFVGVAGLVTYQISGQRIEHDFGLSMFRVFTQLVPSAWRSDPALPFDRLARSLNDLAAPSASVVPPGMESAYGHWGLPGILALGALLGVLAAGMHRAGQRRGSHGWRMLVVSVHILQFVRGSLVAAFVYMIGEALVIYGYRMLLSVSSLWSRMMLVALKGGIAVSPHRNPGRLEGRL